MDILRLVWELLVGSFRGIIVPAAVFVWRWAVVFLLGLIGGGIVVPPLIAEGARRLHRRFSGCWPMQVASWIGAVLLVWLHLHFWVAVAVWWGWVVSPGGLVDVFSLAVLAVCFAVLGLVVWFAARAGRL